MLPLHINAKTIDAFAVAIVVFSRRKVYLRADVSVTERDHPRLAAAATSAPGCGFTVGGQKV
jgi:hypothetical protein